jgi:two-component system, NtrC family, sensor histidine kinase HydH
MRPGLRSRILPGRRDAAEEKALPPGHEEIERQEFSTLFGRIVVARLGLIPVILGALGWLVVVDVTPWRRATLAAVGLAAPVFFVVEWFRFRRKGLTPLALPLNLCFAALVISTLSFATGGLASPFLVVLVPFAVLSGLFSPGRTFALVTAVELAAVWALWTFPRLGLPQGFYPEVFGNRTLAPHVLTVALVLSFVLLMVTAVTRFTRAALQRTIGRTLLAQQESLRAHAERAEELTAMSAEIAHELKNPLASVKGLAGLLAQGASEAKARERLAVLRREVDRMHAILDGFLNFSRPLVPLALGDTDVGALCREVAALHEGMARERGASLEVRAGVVLARCDPRKVKQILINLVQNALEAAADGRAAEIEVMAEPLPGGGARVRVQDRGRGLDPAVGAALFSPGATTKPHGSGLGLPIARALARQHGGELTLAPREGGGTVAELILPGGAPGEGGGRAA